MNDDTIKRAPEIYDVVSLSKIEYGRECTLWTGHEPSPCGNEATHVFVYEKCTAPGDDRRDNCLCCAACKPRESYTPSDYNEDTDDE